jgi:hemoglobin
MPQCPESTPNPALPPRRPKALPSPTAASLLALALCTGLPLGSPAQTPVLPAAAIPSAASDPDTLAAFGGRPGLGALATDFVNRLMADPRTGPFFNGSKVAPLAEKLADQFCVALGGDCLYKGADMRLAHEGMDIRKQDFNALVEVLQQAMDARQIAFSAQNKLLARLAPMHREIINTH